MSDYRSTMWFSICYIRIILFVCFVSAIIDHRKTRLRLAESVVRLVHCSESGSKNRAAQVLLNDTWHPLCYNSNFDQLKINFCKMVEKSFTEKAHIFGETEADVDPNVFATLQCSDGGVCSPIITSNCTRGVVKKGCNSDVPGGPPPVSLSPCSYSGYTVTNCSGHADLWMTYEQAFFNRKLPDVFIAWTSSYLKKVHCNKKLDGHCLVVIDNSTTSSEVDCFNHCLNSSSIGPNITLAAVGIHANMCRCYIAAQSDGRTNCPYGDACTCYNATRDCHGEVYHVTTLNRQQQTKAYKRRMKYCIAVQHSNNTNTFTVRNCSALLPQLCGTHVCWPISPCKNSSPCILTEDYLDYVCMCSEIYTGRDCATTIDSNPATSISAVTTTTSKKHKVPVENPVSTTTLWIAVAVVIVIVILAAACTVFCIYIFRRRRSAGESQRPNSMINRTYGGSVPAASYEHIDDDDTYDLLDEDHMASSHNTDHITRGVLLLDDYSSPNDVVSDTTKQGDVMTEYTTTYDDPIRKQSEHDEAIKLNICSNEFGSGKIKGQQSDIEMKPLKQAQEITEPNEKENMESENRKNQFKGCLCSMNVSAESDMENSEQLPESHHTYKCESGDKQYIDSYLPKPSGVKSFEVNACPGGIENPSKYFTLAPKPDTEQLEDSGGKVSPLNENNQDSNSGNTTTELKSCNRDFDKGGRFTLNLDKCQCHERDEGSDDGSDYEDTSVVDSMENKPKPVTMPVQGDFCLHSPPEVLMERLGIKIVPASCTYETYMALPKSRADLMNPYYSIFNHSNLSDLALRNTRDSDSAPREGSRDPDASKSSRARVPDVSESSRTRGPGLGESQQIRTSDKAKGEDCSHEYEYDKLYNTRRNLQNQNSNHSNNTYDNFFGLWGKHDARKRLNSI